MTMMRGIRWSVLFAVLPFVLAACSAATWQAIGQGLAAASAQAPHTTASADGLEPILIFAGEGHKTFLGCLTCSKYDASSILNEYGDYGSKYSVTSIFNKYSNFGSKYSDTSACNPYASDPPVLVDKNGTFFGRLTVSAVRGDRTRDQRIQAWLAGVCA